MEITPFDSFDEMMERLRREMAAADARVQPWQAEVEAGDYFVRQTPYEFQVYGEVLPDEEPREADGRHYRFCKCYSIACPDGELGDVHVSVIERLLSRQEFDDAKRSRWNPNPPTTGPDAANR